MNTVVTLPLHATNRWFFPLNGQRVVAWMKSTSTIAGLALGVLSSTALCYSNPNQWLITLTSVALINLYAIPKVLKHGNAGMIKAALTVAFAAFGSLAMGGALAGSLALTPILMLSFRVHSIGSLLFSSFFLTGLMGYGAPASYAFLHKAYHMLNQPFWRERFEYLGQRFHRLPEVGLGMMQANLIPHFLLTASLAAPEQMQEALQYFYIQPTQDLQTAWTASSNPSIEQLRTILSTTNQLHDIVQPLPLERANVQDTLRNQEGLQDILYERIRNSIEGLNTQELETAVTILQDQVTHLIPNWMTMERFAGLFRGPVLRAINAKIDDFLITMTGLDQLEARYHALSEATNQLELEINGDQPEQREALSQRLDQIAQQLTQLREEGEKAYREKQRWQMFFNSLTRDQYRSIEHFSQIERLSMLMQDLPSLQRLNTFYQSLFGVRERANGPHLIERLQSLNSRLDEGEGAIKAWLFLGAERCNFRTADYEEVRDWFHVPSLNDLEAKFDEVGLSLEGDLYEKGILPREGLISKEQIKRNLRAYIEEQLEGNRGLRNHIYATLAQVGQLPQHVTSQKVAQLIYRLVTNGLILVPVLIYPAASALGFAMAAVFYACKRFEFRFTRIVEDIFSNRGNGHEIGNAINFAMGRNFFSLTPEADRNMAAFAQAHLFGRLRLLNFEIFATLMIICTYSDLGFGGFIQGVALGREVFNPV